jgi:glycerol-3-phosphate acyltransferase PlsY
VNLDLIIVFLYSYLMGSIPFGLLITKIFIKKDVRNIGSGNIGATNVLRTGYKTLAAFTLLLDMFKGFLSIYITSLYFKELTYLAGLACFIGHIFPIWLKFKGIIFSLSLNFGIVFLLTWLLILFIFRYSSLSSIFSSLIVFLYSCFLINVTLKLFLFILFVIILFTHKENIMKLINKTENKIKL